MTQARTHTNTPSQKPVYQNHQKKIHETQTKVYIKNHQKTTKKTLQTQVSLVNLKSLLKRLQSNLNKVCRSSAAICSVRCGKSQSPKSWHLRHLEIWIRATSPRGTNGSNNDLKHQRGPIGIFVLGNGGTCIQWSHVKGKNKGNNFSGMGWQALNESVFFPG